MLALLYYVALLGIPLLLVGGAVSLDRRSRRGFGLALLALVLIGLTVWAGVAFEQALRRAPSSESFGIAIVLVAYFLIGGYLALLLWIGALVEAGSARQRWWLVGLVVAVLVPGLLVLADNLLDLGARGFGFIGGITLVLVLVLPTMTVLAYGIARSIWLPRQAPLRPQETQEHTA
jgi:hypothetical protein